MRHVLAEDSPVDGLVVDAADGCRHRLLPRSLYGVIMSMRSLSDFNGVSSRWMVRDR